MENDGNGGLQFNMTDYDGEALGTGIYIYRIVQTDANGNESDEETGKFAVIR
jgi:hypothetical protein